MILIGTPDSFGTEQQWLDCIADWHQFCFDQGLKPWEHLTTEDVSFFVSRELYQLRQVMPKAS
ncbi:MAG: hypothetical protein LDL41_25355 [Coleofasciculus sp. S288]|nr:hypothetical protein [Coleofasciculus sp. S288]